MAKALVDNDYDGIVTTIDSIAHEKEIYWNCIDDHDGPKSRLQLLNKWETELQRIIFIQGWTDDVMSRLGVGRINFAFLDAQHTKEDVLKEFKFVSKKQLVGDIVVFDDVTKDYFLVFAKQWNLLRKIIHIPLKRSTLVQREVMLLQLRIKIKLCIDLY